MGIIKSCLLFGDLGVIWGIFKIHLRLLGSHAGLLEA